MEQGNDKQSGWIVFLETLELIYINSLRARQKTTLPIALKLWYSPSVANRSCNTPLHRTVTPLPHRVLPTQALRSCDTSAGIKASQRARILSPPAEPPVLVLWLNQVTWWFSGELPQTLRADSGREPLPGTGSGRRLRLTFLATMRPALDLVGHRAPRVRPTCLSIPRRPRKA
jgi:hypothetical protein